MFKGYFMVSLRKWKELKRIGQDKINRNFQHLQTDQAFPAIFSLNDAVPPLGMESDNQLDWRYILPR